MPFGCGGRFCLVTAAWFNKAGTIEPHLRTNVLHDNAKTQAINAAEVVVHNANIAFASCFLYHLRSVRPEFKRLPAFFSTNIRSCDYYPNLHLTHTYRPSLQMNAITAHNRIQPPTTLNELLAYHHAKHARPKQLNSKVNGHWRGYSSDEIATHVRERALGLYELGVRKSHHVGLLAENSPEWVISDYAILACGAAGVPLYITQMTQQIEYILKDAGCSILFVSSQDLFNKVKPIIVQDFIKQVVLFSPFEQGKKITTIHELELVGARLHSEQPSLYDSLHSAVKPDDTATLMYTSGTTGTPKGVELTHRNLVSNAIDAGKDFDWQPSTDVVFSFLPLTHIFEKTMINMYLYNGVPVWFAESLEKLAENLLEVKPTIMSSVPRMLEKVYDRILSKGAELHGLKSRLFYWSLDLAKQYDPWVDHPLWFRLRLAIASALVFSKWRAAIGGCIRFIISGSAPLHPDLARVFIAAGLPVVQGYGLTETSPVISVNRKDRNKLGSVGPPIDNVEVKIADDGEICVRGPNVMKGFYNAPEKTAEVFNDGWFKTGDVGYIDNDGFLFITDRKKDLIKKSSGKFIAPGPIEAELRTSRYIEHAAVIGEGRKFAIAILFPKFLNLKSWAEQHGISFSSHGELIARPDVQQLYEEEIGRVNLNLNKWERIIKFIISDHELTIADGQLTPTMKLKRRIIEKEFEAQIEALYEKYEMIEVHEHD
jgi:long-chain acyl-CoA synthetase